MKLTKLPPLLICLPLAWAQFSFVNQLQCGNPLSGVCRLQCLSTEVSVYPATCSLYSFFYRTIYQRCVTSHPCCYWSGTCQGSCTSGQVQLSSAATCSNSGDVCCIASTAVTSDTPVLTGTSITASTTASTTTSTAASVASRQGACGSLTAVLPRVLGGREAAPTDWPWMVRITYTTTATTTTGFCAGVLVDSYTVVTAAHCVQGLPTSAIQVRVGEYDLSTLDIGEEVVNIVSYSVAPGYVRGVRGADLAVLKLERTVTFTDRKLPACLPDPTIPLRSPSQCYLAGWGYSEVGLGQRLRSVNTVLLDQPTCEAQIRALAPREAVLPADLVCSLNPPAAPADGCVFDDGGMLVCLDVRSRWALAGIMSEYSCGNGVPVLFTNVSNYTDFILSRL